MSASEPDRWQDGDRDGSEDEGPVDASATNGEAPTDVDDPSEEPDDRAIEVEEEAAGETDEAPPQKKADRPKRGGWWQRRSFF